MAAAGEERGKGREREKREEKRAGGGGGGLCREGEREERGLDESGSRREEGGGFATSSDVEPSGESQRACENFLLGTRGYEADLARQGGVREGEGAPSRIAESGQ